MSPLFENLLIYEGYLVRLFLVSLLRPLKARLILPFASWFERGFLKDEQGGTDEKET